MFFPQLYLVLVSPTRRALALIKVQTKKLNVFLFISIVVT